MEVHVQRELQHGADAVWALLADFGNMSWAPGIPRLEVEGQGVGMVRKIYMDDGPNSIDEQLEVLDSERRYLEYSIPGNNPMPVSDYRASAEVTPLGEGRCRIDWRSRATPAGMSEAEVREILESTYGMMLDWIETHLDGQA